MEHLFVAFLVIHGLLHVAVWSTPKPADMPPPFDPAHSWALAAVHITAAPARTTSRLLAVTAALLFAAAGLAFAVDAAAWTALAVVAALTGLALKVLWFNRWLSLGVALDLGVLAAVASGWPAP